MIVYIVAEIGRDGEYGNVVGYTPVKGFRGIERAKRFARGHLAEQLARVSPPLEGIEITEATDEDVWTLSYSSLRNRIVSWEFSGTPPLTEKYRETNEPSLALLTVEVDEDA